MKQLVVGMLAHVDAGKTTLSEALLYKTGAVRKLGRVDNKDAFLDTDSMERKRGITIFSKQAEFTFNNNNYTLLDTPGHVDFSAETERILWVLDYAILVISGADGVTGHTETLWNLLKRLHIPVFIFVNKMDQPQSDKARIMEQLKNKLSESCVDFNNINYEEAALCDEDALGEYLENGSINDDRIMGMIKERKIFPCYYGSALKLCGIDELLNGIDRFSFLQHNDSDKNANPEFKVFKITHDDRGERLTHLKVCRGILKNKMLINNEKVNQIRVYNGSRFSTVNEMCCGGICAVAGLDSTRAGQYIGNGSDYEAVLAPVLNYKMSFPSDVDPMQMLPKLRMLEEEEPQLHVEWDENFKEIHVSVMGTVLIEVLKNIIKDRFNVEVTFDSGSIVYKETIKNTVEGIGHFEPLRHYAEVHLILEPGERGSGMKYECKCSEDMLDKNWQRLIYTHLCEKNHRGVLTGSHITDVRITLVAGRAHNKHTEGGDFRQATYRAVRNGLMQAETVLLEPFYSFEIELDRTNVGRAMSDLEKMGAAFELKESDKTAILAGEAPVVKIGNYQAELNTYTKGSGKISLKMAGYRPCHNTDEVLEKFAYAPERDTLNPADSVFCANGGGYVVPWYDVAAYAHVESVLAKDKAQNGDKAQNAPLKMTSKQSSRTVSDEWIGTEEIDRILNETYYANSRNDNSRKHSLKKKPSEDFGQYVYNRPAEKSQKKGDYLLVDGYNIIHAWNELDEIAKTNLSGARGRLLDVMCNYQAMKGCELIVVFDAYRVQGHDEEMLDYHNIHVVYTKEAETADHYIEKFAHENGKKYNVRVATSDGLEQVIIRGQGCLLVSAREFEQEVREVEEHIRNDYLNKTF